VIAEDLAPIPSRLDQLVPETLVVALAVVVRKVFLERATPSSGG
jgi:hypothetical protein